MGNEKTMMQELLEKLNNALEVLKNDMPKSLGQESDAVQPGLQGVLPAINQLSATELGDVLSVVNAAQENLITVRDKAVSGDKTQGSGKQKDLKNILQTVVQLLVASSGKEDAQQAQDRSQAEGPKMNPMHAFFLQMSKANSKDQEVFEKLAGLAKLWSLEDNSSALDNTVDYELKIHDTAEVFLKTIEDMINQQLQALNEGGAPGPDANP